jgi:hypothetical protein
VSALVPEVGDRYKHGLCTVQVVAVEKTGPRGPFARLRYVPAENGAAKPVTLERLAFSDKYRYLGNYLPPASYKVLKVGAHWYVKTPAGNVHGAPAGARWTEDEALAVARADAGSRASCRAG